MVAEILVTGNSRVFIAERGAGCGDSYSYYSCMKMGGLERKGQEPAPVYLPDRGRLGRSRIVARVREQDGLWTSSLIGYKPASIQSTLSRLDKSKQPFDLQLHFGACRNLSEFGDYELAIVFEDAEIVGYNADSLGALNGGEVAPVLETVNIIAAHVYELFAIELGLVATSETAPGGEIVGVGHGYHDWVSGKEFGDNFFALQLPYNYNANNAIDHLYILASVDGGNNWTRHTLEAGFPNAPELAHAFWLVAVGDHIVFTYDNNANGEGTIFSLPVTALNREPILSYNFKTIGYSILRLRRIGGRAYGIVSTGAVVWFKPDDLTMEVLEDDTLLTNYWNDIAGLDYDNLLVVGENGVVGLRRSGLPLRLVPVFVDETEVLDNFMAVAMKSPTDWVIGTDEGEIYCTTNAGLTWSLLFSFENYVVRSIYFPTKSRGYVLFHRPAEIWMTSDGGAEWIKIDDARVEFGAYAIMHEMAVAPGDPSTFVAVGYEANSAFQFATALASTTSSMNGFVVTGVKG